MSVENIVTCDRCGAIQSESLKVFYFNGCHGSGLGEYDLCEICAKMHVEWVKGGNYGTKENL